MSAQGFPDNDFLRARAIAVLANGVESSRQSGSSVAATAPREQAVAQAHELLRPEAPLLDIARAAALVLGHHDARPQPGNDHEVEALVNVVGRRFLAQAPPLGRAFARGLGELERSPDSASPAAPLWEVVVELRAQADGDTRQLAEYAGVIANEVTRDPMAGLPRALAVQTAALALRGQEHTLSAEVVEVVGQLAPHAHPGRPDEVWEALGDCALMLQLRHPGVGRALAEAMGTMKPEDPPARLARAVAVGFAYSPQSAARLRDVAWTALVAGMSRFRKGPPGSGRTGSR